MKDVATTCTIFHSRIMKFQENKREQNDKLGKEPKPKSTPGVHQLTDFEVQLQTKLRLAKLI